MPWVMREVWVDDAEYAREQRAEARGLISASEAARRLGRSRTYVQAMAVQQVIRTAAVGGVPYFDEQDVEDLVEGRSPTARHLREAEEWRAEFATGMPPRADEPVIRSAEQLPTNPSTFKQFINDFAGFFRR